jgi:N6-L-threonylcarbamoyladenine synthase
MRILSIETSCDDTGISIMEATGSITSASFKILADNSNSQIKIHIPYGGVFPALAKREHLKNLPILLEKTLKDKNLTPAPLLAKERGKFNKPPVDLITVTYGPGLEIALWTGIVFAQELAKKWGVPLIPVNHMEGHIFSVFVNTKRKFKIPKIKTPALSLLVSGGHTQLILMKKPARPDGRSGGWPAQYEIIGESVDDAVGEAFDKVARMLGLPYPGGPEISKLAETEREKERMKISFAGTPQGDGPRIEQIFQQKNCDPAKIDFHPFSLPRPMLHSKNFNFSFSGLKTAVLYLIRDLGGLEKIDEKTKAQIALEFENAAIECLVYKTAKAIEKYKIKTLIVAGGVSANKYLQSEIKKITGKKVKLYFPPKELTGDNSIMIGIAGYLNYIKLARRGGNKKKVPKIDSIKATGNLRL